MFPVETSHAWNPNDMPHSVSSLLSQIRDLRAQMPQAVEFKSPAPLHATELDTGFEAGNLTAADGTRKTPSFAQTLKHAMEGVNDAQHHASNLSAAFERGEPGADLAQVMVAAQQAQVAFRATVEVRNRLVQAYQDVLNMPV